MDQLRIVASITSDQTNDPDDVPMYDEGNCRYWGAWDDSPIPNVRLFVVFNREPATDEEATETAKAHFGED